MRNKKERHKDEEDEKGKKDLQTDRQSQRERESWIEQILVTGSFWQKMKVFIYLVFFLLWLWCHVGNQMKTKKMNCKTKQRLKPKRLWRLARPPLSSGYTYLIHLISFSHFQILLYLQAICAHLSLALYFILPTTTTLSD